MRSDAAEELLDRELDRALASYVACEPRLGMDKRILRRVHAAPAWHGWAIAASILVLACAGALTLRQPVTFFLGTTLAEWCARLEATWISTSIRESLLVFPVIEGTHLL